MNFFEAQDKAHKNSNRLIFLYVCAVVATVILINFFAATLYIYNENGEFVFTIDAYVFEYRLSGFLIVSGIVFFTILSGTLYKIQVLSKGGVAIAELFNAKPVDLQTDDLKLKRYLNIVEEMAIASGMPIPKTYLTEDDSINAFVAGLSPADAIICITRGALDKLNREELQGVIAHEYSHIVNGDMRLNVRLVSVLHGISMITLAGYAMLRAVTGRRRLRTTSDNNSKLVGIFIIGGITLIVAGYIGMLMANIIKSSISRQREYLADSSAVQYTRDTDGIAGALKKIGGDSGISIDSNGGQEFNHACFSLTSTPLLDWYATHPPLTKRIYAIEPNWDGEFIKPLETDSDNTDSNEQSLHQTESKTQTVLNVLNNQLSIESIGTIDGSTLAHVHTIMAELPEHLRTSTNCSQTAKQLALAILLATQENKGEAIAALDNTDFKEYQESIFSFMNEINALPDEMHLPLLELIIIGLKQNSEDSFKELKSAIDLVTYYDDQVQLNEWIIQRYICQNLDPQFGRQHSTKGKTKLLDSGPQINGLLSTIAYLEHDSEDKATHAFNLGAKKIDQLELKLIDQSEIDFTSLDEAIGALSRLEPLEKSILIEACLEVVYADNTITTKEVEIMRVISACLGCPMPPLQQCEFIA